MNDTKNGSLRTANYSGSGQRRLSGLEHLMDGCDLLPFHIADYWQWAYSDMLRNTQRGVFAEFIVKSALEYSGVYTNTDIRSNFEPFDLLGPNIVNKSTPPPRTGKFQFRGRTLPYRGKVCSVHTILGAAPGYIS